MVVTNKNVKLFFVYIFIKTGSIYI